jgi:uncharacterized protein YodC (DUF2158 family)
MAKAKRLKIGDIVQLNCGSDRMSVVGRRNDGHLVCVWFDMRHAIHRCVFPPQVLVLAD